MNKQRGGDSESQLEDARGLTQGDPDGQEEFRPPCGQGEARKGCERRADTAGFVLYEDDFAIGGMEGNEAGLEEQKTMGKALE